MNAIVLRSDAGHLPLCDSTVDLIVTSPPYFGLRSYTDGGVHYEGQVGDEATPAEYLDALLACTAEWMRVLKPTGSLWVNLGDKFSQRVAARHSSHQDGLFPGRDDLKKDWKRDREAGLARMPRENVTDRVSGAYVPEKSLMGLPWRYALRCIDELGLILRSEVIWAKPNGMPESVTDRVRRCHEQWFHFTLSRRYYSDLDAIREPYAPATAARYATGFGERALDSERPTVNTKLGAKYDQNPLGKLPGSVWTVPTQPLSPPKNLGVDHFAAFPTEFPRRIVSAWSPRAGVVLDPFGGTGTTALVAEALGRTGISVDLSADYCRLAQWRTADPKQRAKVAPAVAQVSLDGVA